MCNLCETKPVYEFTNKRKLCSACFIHWFRKKVFYTIRKFKMAKQKDCIYYEKNKSFQNVVLENVLKIWAEKARAKLIDKKRKNCKVAVADTLDKTSLNFVEQTFRKRKKDFLPIVGKTIKPLYLFLDKEVLLYAKLLKLKFNVMKMEENELRKFIDSLEKNHPEVKRAVVNSYLELFD